jgi:hypothetical protein
MVKSFKYVSISFYENNYDLEYQALLIKSIFDKSLSLSRNGENLILNSFFVLKNLEKNTLVFFISYDEQNVSKRDNSVRDNFTVNNGNFELLIHNRQDFLEAIIDFCMNNYVLYYFHSYSSITANSQRLLSPQEINTIYKCHQNIDIFLVLFFDQCTHILAILTFLNFSHLNKKNKKKKNSSK